MGDLADSWDGSQQALAASRLVRDPEVLGRAIHVVAVHHHWRGEHAAARAFYGTMTGLGGAPGVAAAHPGAVVRRPRALRRRAYNEALACLREGLDLAERLRNAPPRARMLNSLGWVYYDLCHLDLVIRTNEKSWPRPRACAIRS